MAGNTPSSEFDIVDTTTTKDKGNVWQPKPDTESEQKPTPRPEPEPKEYVSFKELGLDKPSPFTGERSKIETFIQECRVYLQMEMNNP